MSSARSELAPPRATALEGPVGTRGRGLLVRVLFAGGVLGAVSLSGCSSDEPTDEAARFVTVGHDLPGALFSVTGTASNDVWVVGAALPDDGGPSIAQLTETGWQIHDSGRTDGDALWVHAFARDSVVVVGSDGMVISYEGESFVDVPAPTTNYDLWGVWGRDATDIWAVGGDVLTTGAGFIWRGDRDGMEVVTLPDDMPTPNAWYKVWGMNADNVWFCGSNGALMHYDGNTFTALDSGTRRPLLTVAGRDDGSLLTVVGGQFSATIIDSTDGQEWTDTTPEGPPLQTFGVTHRGDQGYAVGLDGTVLRYDDGWTSDSLDDGEPVDLHGVWIDPDGGLWVVGGQITAPPFVDGALLYRGNTSVPDLVF